MGAKSFPGISLALAMLLAPTAGGAQTPGARLHGPVTEDRVDPRATLRWEELTRIGSVDGPEEARLSRVSDLAVDPAAGEIFVLDALEYRIKVYSTSGAYLRSWGRRGPGPGELSGAAGISVARDTVAVADGLMVHWYDRSGTHLASIVPRPKLQVTTLDDVVALRDGWRATFREIEAGVTGSTPFQRTYALDPVRGIPEAWTYQRPHPGPGPNPILAHLPVSAPHGEGFVEAPTESFRLRLYDRMGRLQGVRVFLDERVPVAADIKMDYERMALESCQQSPAVSFCKSQVAGTLSAVLDLPTPKLRPMVGALLGSDHHFILVQRADKHPDPLGADASRIWDLVGDDGRWLGRVTFPPRFRPLWLGAREVWGVQLDDLDVPYVVRLRLSGGRL